MPKMRVKTGVIFGVVGVALPLTLFTGSAQLKTVLSDASTLGAGLLAVIVIAKIFTFAVSQGSGFIGGPIFPSLFIGGTAGVFVHQLIPGVPLGLAFTCVFAAVPGALAAAPFTVVLLAAFVSQVGGVADRAGPDRGRDRVPHHGRREVLRCQPQGGTQAQGVADVPA
jgi:Voltage gated chloride channel